MASMRVEQLMHDLGAAGVTVIFKVDHERMAEGGDPWTLVLSGSALGESGLVRAECSTLAECLSVGLERLMQRRPDWDWLTSYFPWVS